MGRERGCWRLVPAALAVVIGLVAQPAHAWEVTLDNVPESGPVLSGERVVWGERSGKGAIVRRAGSGLRPATVMRFSPQSRSAPGTDHVRLALAASAQRLVVDVGHVFEGVDPRQPEEPMLSQPFAATPVEALSPLAPQCQALDRLGGVAVSADVVAFRGPACLLTVRDLSDPSAQPLTLPGDVLAPRVAGRFVAVLERDAAAASTGGGYAVAVHDRLTQQRVYRVPSEKLPYPIAGLSVDADGTIVVAYLAQGPPTPLRMRIARASVQDPELRPLLDRSGHYGARLAGGRLVVVRQPGESTGVVSRGLLQLVDPATGSIRTLAAPVDDELRSPRFDFDGHRVTWVSRTCASVSIHVSTLEDAPGPVARPARCRLLLEGNPRVSKRRVALQFSCAGLVVDCMGDHTTVSTIRTPHRRSIVIARSTPGSHRAGGSASVALTRTGRSLLAGHRRLRVRISTHLGDDDREIYTWTKRAPRRSLIATLRR